MPRSVTDLLAEPAFRGRQVGRLEDEPFSPEALREEVALLSTKPFAGILADFIACAPDMRVVRAWAMENPDRWVWSLDVLRKAVGYADKVHVQQDIRARVSTMSDAELMRALEEAEARGREAKRLVEG